MNHIEIIFLEDLNDFLAHYRRNRWFTVEYSGTPSIKHLVESLGVPHTEIGEVMINDGPGTLGQVCHDSDCIKVLPIKYGNQHTLLQESVPYDAPKFLLDNHLGKLTRYLRILGFDAMYSNAYPDELLAELSARQNRILLTRDRRLLMRKIVQQGYCVRSLNPNIQILEVLDRYNLRNCTRPFNRCLHCNCELSLVEKTDIMDRLEPLTDKYYDEFHICINCDRIYWKGSHYERMLQDLTCWLEFTKFDRGKSHLI